MCVRRRVLAWLCLCAVLLVGGLVLQRAFRAPRQTATPGSGRAAGDQGIAAGEPGTPQGRIAEALRARRQTIHADYFRREREPRTAEPLRLFGPDEYPEVAREKWEVGNVTRSCFAVDHDTAIERELECRAGRRLVFWVSPAFPPGTRPGARVGLEVTASTGRSVRSVLSGTWQNDRSPVAWEPVALDLSPGEGPVTLRLVVTTRQDWPDWPVRPVCLISDPTVIDPDPTDRPNIVLVTVETFRRDHLSLHGYSRRTAPFLEELAHEAVVFDGALSQSCWTRPSVASFLTGLYPSQHRMAGRLGAVESAAPLLPETLRGAGYFTAGFLTNPLVSRPAYNYDQGFDTFADEAGKSLDAVVDDILSWLDKVRGVPFFVYAHTIEPHCPYDAPPPFAEMFAARRPEREADLPQLHQEDLSGVADLSAQEVAYIIARYDGEIAYTDHVLRRLAHELQACSLWDNTLFVLTADHGEELFEHGEWGHNDLAAEKLRIPLIVKLPGAAHGGLRLSGLASAVDIVPTVLSAVGLAVPDYLPGRDLLASPDTGTTGRSVHFAEFWRELDFVISEAHYSIVSETAQFIQAVPVTQDGEAAQWLFDLAADPAAQHNLAAERPDEVASWARLLDRRYRPGCTLAACGADACSTFSGQARSSVPMVEFETTRCEPADSAHLSEDRRTLQFSLTVSGDDDVIWFRTDPDCAELEVDVALDGAPPPLDAVRLGPLAVPAEALPVRLPAARSPADTALAAGRRYGRCPRPVLHLWRTAPCFTRVEGQPQPDEETLRTLKDLGYL
jgi:arylsulfatase A-like enzyme